MYLPEGVWLNYSDKRTLYKSGAGVMVSAPLDTIPVFAKEGAIVPRGDILKANNNWTKDWSPKLRIEVFPSDNFDSAFTYFTGKEARTISCARKADGIQINLDDLGLPGDLEIYCQSYTAIAKDGNDLDKSKYAFDQAKNVLTISFSGATVIEIRGAKGLFGTAENTGKPAPPKPKPEPGF